MLFPSRSSDSSWEQRLKRAKEFFSFTARPKSFRQSVTFCAKEFAAAVHLWHHGCIIMNKPKIIAYLKPSCGWSQGVRAVMRKYDLPFEDRDIINNPLQRQEMIEKSGQMMSPCVEINGQMLPDISGDEVEAFMLANNLVQPVDRSADSPTNQPCAHEMPSAPLNFLRH